MSLPTVLIVEDDDDVLELVALSLERCGLVVSCVPNGRVALEWLVTNEPPRFVLLDMNMPVMGGDELLRLLARDEKLSMIPVVVSSASRGRFHGHRLLEKPYGLAELYAVLAELGINPPQ